MSGLLTSLIVASSLSARGRGGFVKDSRVTSWFGVREPLSVTQGIPLGIVPPLITSYGSGESRDESLEGNLEAFAMVVKVNPIVS